MTLSQILAGQSGLIQSLTQNNHFNDRLSALGIKKNIIIKIIRKATFGGPLHLQIGTTELMVRQLIAKEIIVSPIKN